MEGVLVVAVCTKKDYMAVALPEYPLVDSRWVSINTRNMGVCFGQVFVVIQQSLEEISFNVSF